MQTTGHEAWKTHCSYNELQCKQWVTKQARTIVHTRSYNCKKWELKQGRLIVQTRCNNANNG
ncbi:hypothetical protein KSS87_004263 [Heliosperma pusillum]|nr:hypothetical protein KSS87_004263 [Heliosperma pusillum]